MRTLGNRTEALIKGLNGWNVPARFIRNSSAGIALITDRLSQKSMIPNFFNQLKNYNSCCLFIIRITLLKTNRIQTF